MAEIGTNIEVAASFLKVKDLVGIPTETVYGLAGNALDEEAILKIYETKERPQFDPLIAHVDTREKLDRLVEEIPEKARELMDRFWPGPLTLLLKKSDRVPDLLTSGLDRIAVRVPDHSITLSLLAELDFPLAAPSANPFGYVSPTTALHVSDQLGSKIPYILDGGPCRVGLESTIVGFSDHGTPVIHRLGGIGIEDIQEVVGSVDLEINVSSDPKAPGMLKSHYAPGKKIIIGDIEKNLALLTSEKPGVISFDKSYEVADRNLFILSPDGRLEEAARNIFAALRKMDKEEIDVILAEYVPEEGLGKAINDRLKRAAAI